MKIGIDVLGGDFPPEANLKGFAMAKNDLLSGTTTTLIGDQEHILSGLSLLNEDIACSQVYSFRADKGNVITHSWEVANSGLASKVNKAYN